jgi:hypothetical protein
MSLILFVVFTTSEVYIGKYSPPPIREEYQPMSFDGKI